MIKTINKNIVNKYLIFTIRLVILIMVFFFNYYMWIDGFNSFVISFFVISCVTISFLLSIEDYLKQITMHYNMSEFRPSKEDYEEHSESYINAQREVDRLGIKGDGRSDYNTNDDIEEGGMFSHLLIGYVFAAVFSLVGFIFF